jgi:hypothetical protein
MPEDKIIQNIKKADRTQSEKCYVGEAARETIIIQY